MNDGRRASRDRSRARALVRDELCANARKTLPCRRPPSSSSSSSVVVLRRRPPSRTFPSLGAPSSSRCGEGVTDRPTPPGRDSSFEDPHHCTTSRTETLPPGACRRPPDGDVSRSSTPTRAWSALPSTPTSIARANAALRFRTTWGRATVDRRRVTRSTTVTRSRTHSGECQCQWDKELEKE